MDVKQRQDIERQIATAAATGLISAGYQITIYCDEDKVLSRTDDVTAIIGAMFSSDSDAFMVYQRQPEAEGQWERIGWVQFIYGNSGWDVINDNTDNLEYALQAATALGEELEQKFS